MTRRDTLYTLMGAPLAAQSAARPNMVFILMDDLRWDEIGAEGHPFVKTPNIDRIAREGARFRNAFVTSPLCSPSRACFLTGQYAHAHGIKDNTDRSALSHKLPTFPMQLAKAGYENAFVGKWHMGVDDSPRPGFIHLVSFKGQGVYFNPEINVNGKTAEVKGYTTDILTDHAVEFLKRDHSKPFLLYVAHKAVHPELTQFADGSLSDPAAGKFLPADRHKSLYASERAPRRPNAHGGLQGKPALQRKLQGVPPLSAATRTDDETIRNRLRMLQAVDEGVGRIFETLTGKGLLDNTVFVFTSDEGYFLGEHGLSVERRLAYEESIRIPLLIRYPKLIKAGSTPDGFALGIDLAPTMCELGGATPMARADGRSLLPLLKGQSKGWRNSFLIEHFSDKVFPRMEHMAYRALRTDRWKYIEYTELSGMEELYDLKADPYEEKNLAGQPALRAIQQKLHEELTKAG
ncbi:MAG: sulfatase [Bryobacteraceae bacterium]